MCKYVLGCDCLICRTEELNKVLPEGLPLGMVKEFEEAMQSAVLVRQSFLDLRDNFRRIVDPPLGSARSKGMFFFDCFVELWLKIYTANLLFIASKGLRLQLSLGTFEMIVFLCNLIQYRQSLIGVDF